MALPHTWNALDGQDGGADYWRGTGLYRIALPAPQAGQRQYIQFEAANHVATVRCNGQFLGSHKGGFSTFRFDCTDAMQPENNLLEVEVTNASGNVYPQQADFTFCGGLYRNVSFLQVAASHIDLMQHGSSGVFVTGDATGAVQLDTFVANPEGCTLVAEIAAPDGNTVATASGAASAKTTLNLTVEHPQLWQGRKNPALYTATVTLYNEENVCLDTVQVTFGLRSYAITPDEGFVLNGEVCPLRGVARHQDRQDKGWAISEADQRQDMQLIADMGANTIRLAHYQHSQYFYDLCDQAGMAIWAEIPFISVFNEAPEARENTLSQMTELVLQNYNHPSIIVWGISNEISIGGETEALLSNLQALHDLCKQLDPTRLTTMAQMTILEVESAQNQITDVLSYNHYFGWYMGDVSQNGPWLDNFHALHPTRALGVSEYGAEGILSWHSATPECKDYTEEYQAFYHEEMLNTFATRPWLWATHVWNMFDFAADARDEGGCKGRNNKGLVTYDRSTCKDSYFIYKAHWSSDEFVHLCGRRFVQRAPGQRDIKVYSNLSAVTLLVNGVEIATQTGDKVFVFADIALQDGENTITAKAGNLEDTIVLEGVDTPNEAYNLFEPGQNDGQVENWFTDIAADAELVFLPGRYSIQDNLKELMANPATAAIVGELLQKMPNKMPVANMESVLEMIGGFKLEMLMSMMGKIPQEVKIYLNQQLSQVEKTTSDA